jgi:hypothetical protein
MDTPDFAQRGLVPLPAEDVRFLLEHFPGAVDIDAASRELSTLFNTLDSMLEADYVYDALCGTGALNLPVSPQLFFEVMLRRALPGRRSRTEQKALHYVAHLLRLYVRAERLHRVQDGEPQTYEYLVDLVVAEQEAPEDRRFLVQAQIANYALFLAGVNAEWIDHRHRYAHRPVTPQYYADMGATRFYAASRHRLAESFGLTAVYRELAFRFEYYRAGLQRLASRIVPPECPQPA